MTIQFEEHSLEHFLYEHPQFANLPLEELFEKHEKWIDELIKEMEADMWINYQKDDLC